MDMYTDLSNIAEKYEMSLISVKSYWSSMVEYKQAGCPHGDGDDGLRKWQNQRAFELARGYMD